MRKELHPYTAIPVMLASSWAAWVPLFSRIVGIIRGSIAGTSSSGIPGIEVEIELV
jgi:hypothetical protein